ncbi:type 11 methyltransferase [Actinoplanes sp. SE50]|uniref:class I SAM-dependent methyltransferase n=1 Tax=unclassified Actinoplanes TaxID=2626549 RepID=UPI00023ECD92|nr:MULTISPECIES: class I SAM-dependent methyltransferase [unclassified Actinoplanes]AEV87741.1 tRNA (mo5U34)-methyltransferase [Actinoplanes sp. SE50/110]ATO86143.1 type 11 methyltransferase [Actinoplanes sp. SE50]SLM03557.1 Demethylmenaquinone methyltransferase [Actinoplanes sp. SE50/110]
MPERISEVTALLAEVLAPRAPLTVIVDGGDPGAAADFASRLAAAFPASARAWSIDAVLGLTGPGRGGGFDSALNVLEPATDQVLVYLRGGPRNRFAAGDGERRAQVVIDHRDPDWPVIRHVHPSLADPDRWYLSESRAFFAARAANWDVKFGDDLPAYARAVREAGVRPGDVVLDVGCGTGRALPALAAAAAPGGRVIGLDFTPDMLAEAARAGRDASATLLVADARRLPIATGAADVIFAAGLINHLPDPVAGLAELARVTRPGGTIAMFHPVGRAALATRHGRTLRPDEPLGAARLAPLLAGAGWVLTSYEDGEDRFLALATRL